MYDVMQQYVAPPGERKIKKETNNNWSTPKVKIGRLGAAGGQNGQNLPGQVLRLPEPPNR